MMSHSSDTDTLDLTYGLDTFEKTAGAGNTAGALMLALKRDILNGVFAADQKLLMSSLKERYQVGTGPLREALSQLVVERLVTVEDQRGYRVPPMSREEMQDLYRVRAEIESLCITQALELGDLTWESEVLAAMHRLAATSKQVGKGLDELLAWERHHQAFHFVIASGCNSPTLLQIRQSLYERTARYRLLWLKDNMSNQAYFDSNQKEHEELCRLVLARDKAGAVALITHHLQSPSRMLSEWF
ncbi:DNA-binding transcriptional regulator CsiR [Neisseria sp. ZJ106]|uniref:DNA-binding transcriptional regulator CsiR n=1 Tax=Neisseria lisongii TaxID=2912188 RepID=A0AAW5AKB5_9NEIS|nr:DNA-binding transcriptional regulator CsiR [Neisseria lisongii]MCF7522019.1 DNA-binding transcriptional regulator CsiR [Neisseria lisongii]MCF7530347.1 DNA-binding transcriptional regulator CsiR [Neisseria lisongii]WCL71096.1 DNA-binding transcriptional regulator CsiR [Neisseria lisongii]